MTDSAEANLRKRALESLLSKKSSMDQLSTDSFVKSEGKEGKPGTDITKTQLEDGEVDDEPAGSSDLGSIGKMRDSAHQIAEGSSTKLDSTSVKLRSPENSKKPDAEEQNGNKSSEAAKMCSLKADTGAVGSAKAGDVQSSASNAVFQSKASPVLQGHSHFAASQGTSSPSTPTGSAASLPNRRSKWADKISDDEQSSISRQRSPASALSAAGSAPLPPPSHPPPEFTAVGPAAAGSHTPSFSTPTLEQPSKTAGSTGPIRSKWADDSPPPQNEPPPKKTKSKWADDSPPPPTAETPSVADKPKGGKWESRSHSREPDESTSAKAVGDNGTSSLNDESILRAATATGDASAALDMLENRLRPALRSATSEGEIEVMDLETDADRNQVGEGGADGDTAADGGRGENGRAVMGLHRCREVDKAYTKLNKIDEGTYGVVFRAKCLVSSRIVALKQVKLEQARDGFPLTALRELTVLLELKHVNIVEVFEVVVSPKKQVFMVMEYMDHDFRSLMEAMPRHFRTSEVKCLMHQLLSGVEYMHRHWVIHRDMKTSNLLLDNNGVLKVCDFGLARLYRDPIKAMTPNVVTLWYRAPELLYGDKSYSTAIDMWSVGCIFGELVLKAPLLQGKHEADMVDKIARLIGSPTEDDWPGFKSLPGPKPSKRYQSTVREKIPKVSYTGSPSMTDIGLDLLLSLLNYDPARRITAQAALKHPWFDEPPLKVRPVDMPTYPSMHEVPKGQRKRGREVDDDGPAKAFFDDDSRFNRE